MIVAAVFFSFPAAASYDARIPEEWREKVQETGAGESGPMICQTDAEVRVRLISAANTMKDGERKEVYIISDGTYPDGSCLKAWFGNRLMYSNDEVYTDGTYRVHRFLLQKENGMKEILEESVVNFSEYSEGMHFRTGDRMEREIDGAAYSFTCIDEDYVDSGGNHTGCALFLMDTVLPSGYQSSCRWETDKEGRAVFVREPGPVSFFGESNEYADSKIRAFLEAAGGPGTRVQTGTRYAYTGSTGAGLFSQTTEKGLKKVDIGYQEMTSDLFILSLEEAIRYRETLWQFRESGTETPAASCGAYWLRTPSGDKTGYAESGLCYVVDLISGNIHPMEVKPGSETGDPYADTQSAAGVRPAFTLPNY